MNIPLSYPDLNLELDPAVLVVDSTKLKTFMDCPRKYFYEYVLGWRAKQPSLALEFGSAWHIAMETLLKGLKAKGEYDEETITEAYRGFYDYLSPIFDPKTMGPSMSPKDYGNAMKALVEYTQQYQKEGFEVLYTEISGSVPISDKHEMYFRVDAVCKDSRGMFALEHKTTSRLMSNWAQQWSLSVQVGCYTHVLYCLHGVDGAWGVIVNGTVFRKTENAFVRVPIHKTKDMMQVWLEIVNSYFDMIEREFELLDTSDKLDAQTMRSFPMNTESCTKYGVCPFHDMCSVWPNPLRNTHRVPPHMEVKHWDPRDLDENCEMILRRGEVVKKETVE